MTVTAAWVAKNIADVWMRDPLPEGHQGWVRFDPELLDGSIFENIISHEDLIEELGKEADSRGFNYQIKMIEDFDIDANLSRVSVYWRRAE